MQLKDNGVGMIAFQSWSRMSAAHLHRSAGDNSVVKLKKKCPGSTDTVLLLCFPALAVHGPIFGLDFKFSG